ncbi:MAG: polysaccharide deacetylase family protein [Dokdonella sp.]
MRASAPIRNSVALMYHALSVDAVVAEGQDPHYSLRSDVFDSHLKACAAHGARAMSARDWLADSRERVVLLSFDDGHVSNYDLAFPLLAAHAATADFFVNTANVGTPGYANWAQLRAMADAGQSIQSHSHTHRYLTALNDRELVDELTRSRRMIEQEVGKPVSLLAPPGGRMPDNLARVATDCGYQHILSSRPGRIAGDASMILPRMAVTSALDDATLSAWLRGDALTFAKARLRYAALAAMKRLFGDTGYERLRQRALGRAKKH